MSDPVEINVGGTLYLSSKNTLTSYSDSLLAEWFGYFGFNQLPLTKNGHYFIDRDGRMFGHVLNFLRNSKLLIPDNFTELDLLLEEARYYGIKR